MFEIKDLLQRFENILGKESLKIGVIQESIQKNCGFLVEKEKIHFKNKIINLKIKPLFKNEVLLKKHAILENLSKEGVSVDDIH